MIIFCTKGLSGWLILSPFIQSYPNQIQYVIEFPVIPKKSDGSKRTGLIRKIRSSSIHYLWFNIITIKAFDIISRIFGNTMQSLCRKKRIQYKKIECIDEEFTSWLKSENPDYILNASSNILRSNLLNIPKCGVLNYHCARLPEFRGAANYFWHLIEKVSLACGTLHYVTPELDEGEIISYSSEFDVIPKKTSVFSLWREIRINFQEVMKPEMGAIEQGLILKSTPQNEAKVKVRSFPNSKEVRQLFSNGFRVFRIQDYIKILRVAISGKV